MNNSQGNPNISAHKVLHFYRNRVMNLFVFVAIIFYFIFSVYYTVPKELNRCYELLSVNVQQAETYEKYADDANNLYHDVQDESCLSIGGLYLTYVDSETTIGDVVDMLNEALDENDTFFYLNKDGSILSSEFKSELTLSSNEINELINNGSYQVGNVSYYSIDNNDGYLLVKIEENGAKQFSMDTLQLISLDGFVFDNETLDVVEKDEENIPNNYGEMYVGEEIENDYFTGTNTQIRLISSYTSGIKKYTNMKLAAIDPLVYQDNGYSLVAYVPLTEILSNILIKSGLPTLLCISFIFLCIFGSLHFREILLKEKNDPDAKKIKLPFNCYVNRSVARHILFLQFFMGIIIIFCTTILLILSRFELNYVDTKYNLEQLVTTENMCEDALEDCWDVYTEPALGLSEGINQMLVFSGQDLDSEETKNSLESIVDNTFIEEISIYDRDGENVYTTSPYAGYPLSEDTDSVTYQFWDLINSDKQYIIIQPDSDDDLVYCALRRSDEVGVIVVTFSDQGFGDLKEKLSKDSVTSNFYYRNNCLFVDKDLDLGTSNNVAYQIAGDGTKTTIGIIDLPTLTTGQNYCGFKSFNNENYFITGLGEDNRSVFYFSSVSELLDGISENVITYVVFLLIICLFDFIGCAVYTPETVENKDDNIVASRQPKHIIINRLRQRLPLTSEVDESQKKIWQQGLYSTICLIAITLLIDALLNKDSIYSFLIDGPWEKGFNIFALTLITLVVLSSYLLFRFFDFLFREIGNNFPYRYIAEVQMVHSVLKIVIIICIFIFSANVLGIDTSTVLASVGVTGLALGIAAKDTINDMICGIFIILDGRIEVGDWIEVDDFYGQVKKIGIRTTKIQYYNIEKSINNSDMKNLFNYSRGESSVYFDFTVATDTDLDFLEKLLKDSTPRFNEACRNELIGEMKLKGVVDFNKDYISVKCIIGCNERRRKSYTKRCKRVLVNILRENNIKFGNDFSVEIMDQENND